MSNKINYIITRRAEEYMKTNKGIRIHITNGMKKIIEPSIIRYIDIAGEEHLEIMVITEPSIKNKHYDNIELKRYVLMRICLDWHDKLSKELRKKIWVTVV